MKERGKIVGLLLTLTLSVVVLLLLFGTTPFLHLKTNMFGKSDDVQKDIFNTYWNAKYDSTVLHSGSMNYPYGEEVSYTGCQTFVSAPLQWIRRAGWGDYSRYTLLLMNLILIIAILACPLFLYLIFHELKVAEWLAVVAAALITFFSPQMGRVSAHLTLAYLFIVPCAVYLFLRWWTTRRVSYSVWIALLSFFAMLAHPYYIVFIGAMWAMVWLFFFLSGRRGEEPVWKSVCHCLLQMGVPVLLFVCMLKAASTDGVRALLPIGFYDFNGSLLGTFFPNGRFGLPKLVRWEGLVWIGLLAMAVFVVGLVKTVAKICRREWRELLRVTDNEFLNLMFWTSVLVLLFSYGIPLLWFPLRFLAHLGPLGQFRALGRFGWFFFFMMNIVAVYTAANQIRSLRFPLKITVSVLVVGALMADVVALGVQYKFRKVNVNPSLIFSDIDNKLPENQWVDKINTADYQSVLPLSYFSVGSEHLNLSMSNEDFCRAFYVSAKTGLPMHSIHASRSVISQIYNNLALARSPYLPFAVLSDLPDRRPILLTAPAGAWIHDEESKLLHYATPLFTANGIEFYKMEIAAFHQYEVDFQKEISCFADSCSRFEVSPNVFCSDSASRFVLRTLDEKPAAMKFVGNGAAEHCVTSWETVYDGCPNLSGTVEISFLLSDYLDARSGYYKFRAVRLAPDGKEIACVDGGVSEVFNGWARVSFNMLDVNSSDHIVVSVWNRLRGKDCPVSVDNLLLRQEEVHVVNGDGTIRLLDNRLVK
ncbi:MAG: hypothetical protein J5642_00110 [Bacteroidales bacterium]|nr:hypothetical protein [Bacteroidales bacterium]